MVLGGLRAAAAAAAVITAAAAADTTTGGAEALPTLGVLTEDQLRLVYETVTVRLSFRGMRKAVPRL